jgi:integral membrane protein
VSEPVSTAVEPTVSKAKLDGALLRFRIMAFVTGVVLICGTIALILKDAVGLHHMEPGTGLLWVLHGYLYLVYVITVLNLRIKARWHLVRMALVALAGTIPTMSFVAEHIITRYVRARA